MNHLTIFTHEKLTSRLTLLTEGPGRRIGIGIVEGDEAVLVMDAGAGVNSELRSYIEGITGPGKPILCACTHGHTMHLGSARLFDKAYLNSRDWTLAKEVGLNTEKRLANILDRAGGIPALEEYVRANYMVVENTEFEDYDDGFVFDLGGVQVRALALPGHTPGSMLLWCEQENWLFAGDAIAQNVSLKTLDRTGLKQYKNDLEALTARLPEDVKIYSTDELTPLRLKDVRALILACEEILMGKTLNDLPGESNFTDNSNRPEMRAHYVENCSVAYDSGRVGAPRSDLEDFLFYSYEKVSEHIYVLAENNARDSELTLGLVVGDHSALLIDTGMGMNGQLRGYVESIVGNKHLIAASTHGNIDHLGGSIMFDDRRLNERDWDEVGRATGTPRRFGDIGNFCHQNAEALRYCERHWVNNENTVFQNIEAGEVLDLGGVSVEVLYSAGHTPGHLSYYIPSEKICFVGDSLNRTALLRRLTGAEFARYADNLEKLYQHIGPDTTLYSGHSNRGQEARYLLNVVQACRELVEGKTEDDPPCNVLRPDKPGGLRSVHFVGNYGVIYEKGLLDKTGYATVDRTY